MKTITHNIFFIDSLTNFIQSLQSNVVFLVDENVQHIYGHIWKSHPIIILPSGEKSKSLSATKNIIKQLLKLDANRNTFLLSIGGGVTTDIGGFVATIYKRGIRFGHMPTTLLAMCDASIGGKNGINFSNLKNVIGTIHQPEFVAIFPEFLKTLPNHEFKNGMGEIVKHAIIDGNEHVNFLQNNYSKIVSLDFEIIRMMIEKSVKVKMSIVENDEMEIGQRRLLNLGHTLAHAIETIYKTSHGNAVAMGIYYASRLSMINGYCSSLTFDKIIQLLNCFDLNGVSKIDLKLIIPKIIHDKKNYKSEIYFVFPFAIGDCRIVKLEINTLMSQLKAINNG